MKTRLFAFLILVCFVMGILVPETFCATAKRKPKVRHISEDFYPSETVPVGQTSNKYAPEDSADCFDLAPDERVPAVTEHDWVGSTHLEYQKNGSMGRMISVTSSATGGYRHVSYMWSGGVYPPGPREVRVRSKPLAGAWGVMTPCGDGALNSGYSNQTHLEDGTSVVVFHRTWIGGNWSYLAMADGPAADPLYTRKWDLPDDLPEGASGEVGAWPKCEVLYTLDSTIYPYGPLNFVHVIETEGNTAGGEEQWIGYLRCYVDPSDSNNLKCQTPTTYPEVYNIPANTAFQDEVYGFGSSCDISAVVVTGRRVAGRKVAIAYMPPAVAGDCDYLGDVAYIECVDNGDGWLDGTEWPPTIHKITNFGTSGYERAFHDLSACYDYDDSLHIVYVTCGFDPAQPGYYQPGVARLYHWCQEYGTSTIASKIQDGANPPAHNVNIGKPSISAKDPIYHPGGDSIYLSCIWTAVDSSDQNAAGDQGNGDLYWSGTFDGGNTWGQVLNLTGTKTPGCTPGNCVSEHWPSMAQNMLDGDLHIEYICDRDAGGAIMDEGTWTRNHVMYMRQPEPPPPCPCCREFRITDPPHWYHPPIKVRPNQTRTIRFKLYNVGNADLIYSVTSDHPCIQVNIPPAPLPPKDSVEVLVLLDGTGACDDTFIAGHVILETSACGGKTDYLRVHAVVADDYYECPRDSNTVDTLDNGVLELRMNANCQMEIDDIGSGPDTTFEVFFRGGTIVATTLDGNTLVGRYMGYNDMRAGAQEKLYREQCEPDWEPHYWVVYTKDIYIEASHLDPPSHQKWWWWEISKQVKFFKEDAPEVYKHMVIKYVRVKRHDPPSWWPDQTPFSHYEDTYIGFAMDIDCPADTFGDQYASNYAGYDVTNEIAWQRGFDYTGAHPEYNDYYAGIALADPGISAEQIAPYGTFNVRNDQYLYPQGGWGWLDGELYQLASTAGNNIQDPGSATDRTQVLTARKIDAGTDPDAEASFTVVQVVASSGLAQLQAYVDSARAIVTRESPQFPAICGDINEDGVVDVGDVIDCINYLFKYGSPVWRPISCPKNRADVNNDGIINIGDIVYLVSFLYRGSSEPVCPGIWY